MLQSQIARAELSGGAKTVAKGRDWPELGVQIYKLDMEEANLSNAV